MTAGGYNPTNSRLVGPPADLFSLAIVAYEMYRFNLYQAPRGSTHQPAIVVHNNSLVQHQQSLESICSIDMTGVPSGIAQLLANLLNLNCDMRISAIDITSYPAFNTGTLAVLRTIDNLHTRDIGTQASQLSALSSQLEPCPPRLLESSVLVSICKICMSNAGR
jgi:serine/threonine protein kinase